MAKNEPRLIARLRLNEVRVLLALNRAPTHPLTISEIAALTAYDTPSKEGVTESTVKKALDGVAKSDKMHESTGYPGLVARRLVKRVGKGFQISLPDPRPGPRSDETEDEE